MKKVATYALVIGLTLLSNAAVLADMLAKSIGY